MTSHIDVSGVINVIYLELDAFAEIAQGTIGQVSLWQWYVFRLQIRMAPVATLVPRSVVADARRVTYCLRRKTKYGILKCVKNKVESHVRDCWMLTAGVLISSE